MNELEKMLMALSLKLKGTVSKDGQRYVITTKKRNRLVINVLSGNLINMEMYTLGVGRVGQFRCIATEEAIMANVKKVSEGQSRPQSFNMQVEVYHGLAQ